VSISDIYHILQDSSVGSLLIVVTSKATYPFHTAAILLFHFLQHKFHIFLLCIHFNYLNIITGHCVKRC